MFELEIEKRKEKEGKRTIPNPTPKPLQPNPTSFSLAQCASPAGPSLLFSLPPHGPGFLSLPCAAQVPTRPALKPSSARGSLPLTSLARKPAAHPANASSALPLTGRTHLSSPNSPFPSPARQRNPISPPEISPVSPTARLPQIPAGL